MKTIILGAGLTGLSAAYHGNGEIYEKEKEIGGKCISPRVQGYAFDLGIHVLHTRNNYVINLLLKKFKAGLNIQRRRAWIYSYNRLTRYPFQANTYGLPEKIVKDCLLGFIEIHDKQRVNCGNYQDWIYAAFGRGVAEHFLIPYSEKFWTVSPSEMTADWPDLRVPRPSLSEVVAGAITDQTKGFGPNWQFSYPKRGGIGMLPNLFRDKELRVFLNKQATAIDALKKEVEFSGGEKKSYDKLISTIPLPELVKIIRHCPRQVILAARNLKYNSIFCVNLGINRAGLNNSHWIYYPKSDYSFFRISFPKNLSREMAPANKSSITAEVSYSKNKRIDKKTIVNRVIKDLIKAKVLTSKDKIDLVDTRDIKYAYVIYDHDRSRNLAVINKFLKNNDICAAGRYGSWAYYWMDDAILDGKRAAGESTIYRPLP